MPSTCPSHAPGARPPGRPSRVWDGPGQRKPPVPIRTDRSMSFRRPRPPFKDRHGRKGTTLNSPVIRWYFVHRTGSHRVHFTVSQLKRGRTGRTMQTGHHSRLQEPRMTAWVKPSPGTQCLLTAATRKMGRCARVALSEYPTSAAWETQQDSCLTVYHVSAAEDVRQVMKARNEARRRSLRAD